MKKRMALLALVGILYAVRKPIQQFSPADAMTLLCDGQQTADLAHLDKPFRKKIDRILQTLSEEGYAYTVSSTYRSPQRQQCLYDISQHIKKYTGQQGFTSTTKSCHNNLRKGQPASLAIDVHIHNTSMERKVQFYKRLRDLSVESGLVSGGNFRKSNPVWAHYGLGWDPGHIQQANCKSKLRTS